MVKIEKKWKKLGQGISVILNQPYLRKRDKSEVKVSC